MVLSFTDDGSREFSIFDENTGNGIGTVMAQVIGEKCVYTIYIWDELLEDSLDAVEEVQH